MSRFPTYPVLMGDSIGPKGRPVLATSFREEAAAALPVLRRLTREQEAQHVLDRKLLLVAVCALNHWSAEEIVAAYQITRAECVKPDSRACANGLGRGAVSHMAPAANSSGSTRAFAADWGRRGSYVG